MLNLIVTESRNHKRNDLFQVNEQQILAKLMELSKENSSGDGELVISFPDTQTIKVEVYNCYRE